MDEQKYDFKLGEDLYGVSIHELESRIELLTDEISRLQAELEKKAEEKTAAEKLFGGGG